MGEIDKLRAYFKGLKTPQKKEFIHKLRQRIAGVSNSKYASFLAECVEDYKREVADSGDAAVGAELFAKAFAAMLNASGTGDSGAIGARLVGRWQRDESGSIFYYDFKDDGTFETNEVSGHEVLRGNYSTGLGGSLLIEPHELVQFTSLMFSGDGNNLIVGLPDGSLCEYSRIAKKV